MQRLVFSMRESMPHFVCSLRQVDEWKRFQAKQSQVFTQAAYDINAKYVKSPFAKSLKIEDLLRFIEDTALDIEFMVQLPSIEKCLDQWWKVYAKDKAVLDPDQFRQVYYDLANVLVQAKTENIHKNSVSMIMRSSWTKWSPKEAPLGQPEFYRIMFVLAHLMTESNRLGDYVTFFQETLAKITRVFQAKAKRSEVRKRKPRMHRKSSVVEIMAKPGLVRMRMGSVPLPQAAPNQQDGVSTNMVNKADTNVEKKTGLTSDSGSASGNHGVVNVTLQRVLTTQGSGIGEMIYEDEMCADRFVEVLDRRGVLNQKATAQHIVVDPLLYERRFQEKWRRPMHERTLSSDGIMRLFYPQTNKYVPPLTIARLHTSPPCYAGTKKGGLNSHHRSMSMLAVNPIAHDRDVDVELEGIMSSREKRDCEVLRRSLSNVTLKKRLKENKSKPNRAPFNASGFTKNEEEAKQDPMYLAIST